MSAPAFTIVRSTRLSRIAAIVVFLVAAALAAAPLWSGSAGLRLMGEIYTYIALASLWNLLAGYAGLVSVGQQAYVGFGGYMLFAFSIFGSVHPLLAIVIAGVLGGLISAPVALLMFRLRGAYFAIGTWVVAEVFRLAFAQVSALGGGSGTSLPPSIVREVSSDRYWREDIVYWAALLLGALAIGLVYYWLRSRQGLALTAIRDDETASESLGIAIWRTKLAVYVVVGAVTAMVGALIFLQKLRISPDAAFNVNDWTAYVIFMTVIGGIGTIEGPIIGALIFFLLRQTLAQLGTIYLLILGFTAIIIMLTVKQGLWGFVANRFDIALFPIQRRIRYLDGDPGSGGGKGTETRHIPPTAPSGTPDVTKPDRVATHLGA